VNQPSRWASAKRGGREGAWGAHAILPLACLRQAVGRAPWSVRGRSDCSRVNDSTSEVCVGERVRRVRGRVLLLIVKLGALGTALD
jgi:hypothetical protein